MDIMVISLSTVNYTIKRKLIEMRVSHGLSVSAIRDYLGLNTTYAVYKWFHGESIPSVDNLLALSMLFNTSINELLVYHT